MTTLARSSRCDIFSRAFSAIRRHFCSNMTFAHSHAMSSHSHCDRVSRNTNTSTIISITHFDEKRRSAFERLISSISKFNCWDDESRTSIFYTFRLILSLSYKRRDAFSNRTVVNIEKSSILAMHATISTWLKFSDRR